MAVTATGDGAPPTPAPATPAPAEFGAAGTPAKPESEMTEKEKERAAKKKAMAEKRAAKKLEREAAVITELTDALAWIDGASLALARRARRLRGKKIAAEVCVRATCCRRPAVAVAAGCVPRHMRHGARGWRRAGSDVHSPDLALPWGGCPGVARAGEASISTRACAPVVPTLTPDASVGVARCLVRCLDPSQPTHPQPCCTPLALPDDGTIPEVAIPEVGIAL